jgi:putative methionine-R-sulfoxide reductase with GAF domain
MTDRQAPSRTPDPARPDSDSRRILQSMLAFARLVFDAPAASVFTYDETTDELRFEASSGVGATALAGMRMPATAGIAGMVVQTGMATIADDLATSSQFNRDFAAQSGYVPNAICAAPLLYDDDLLGVIEILDPDRERFGSLDVMTIVEGLADQVAVSLYVLRELRRFSLRNPAGPKRRRISSLVDALPEDAFDDGRSGILEAVLAELNRSRA